MTAAAAKKIPAPLRLTVVCQDEVPTPAVEWALDVAAGLSQAGHHVQVIASRRAAWSSRVRELDVTLGSSTAPAARLWRWRRHPPLVADGVILSRPGDRRFLSRRVEMPVLVRWEAEDATPDFSGLLSYRVLVSDESELRTAAEHGVAPERLRVVRQGVVTEVVTDPEAGPTAQALRYELRLPRAAPLLLQAAPLTAQGGHDVTFHALRVLLDRRADLHPNRRPNLVLLGAGPAQAEIRDKSHALRLNEHVIWVGQRPHLERYVAAADAVLHPGRAGLPNRVVLHALALGTPLIAGRAAGEVREVARVVGSNEPAAWANAIEAVLDDPAVRLHAEAERSRFANGWSQADFLDDLECGIRALRLASRPAAARAALLLDRDGTLVHNVPYNGSPEHVALQPGAGRALRWLRDAGLRVIVVSNQSGVARGLFSTEDAERVNARINDLLAQSGACIDAFYLCPHHPDFGPTCGCRKPAAGMLLQAARDHDLDLSRCWTAGDAPRDVEAGRTAGTGVAVFGSASVADAPAYQRWPQLVRDFLRWQDARNHGVAENSHSSASGDRDS